MTKRHPGTFRRDAARVARAGASSSSTDLERYAAETVQLLRRVNELIVEADASSLGPQPGGGKVSKRSVFPAPWNTPAGHMFTTVAQRARDHEMNLALLVFGAVRYRGTSDDNTFAAIERLPVLITAAVRNDLGRHQYVTAAVASLAGWPARLRAFLDEDPEDGDPQPWTRAPGDLRCPHCKRPLWLRPGWQHEGLGARIYCQRCRDEAGALLSWESSVWLGVLQQQ